MFRSHKYKIPGVAEYIYVWRSCKMSFFISDDPADSLVKPWTNPSRYKKIVRHPRHGFCLSMKYARGTRCDPNRYIQYTQDVVQENGRAKMRNTRPKCEMRIISGFLSSSRLFRKMRGESPHVRYSDKFLRQVGRKRAKNTALTAHCCILAHLFSVLPVLPYQ